MQHYPLVLKRLGNSDVIISRFYTYVLAKLFFIILSTCLKAQQNAWPGNRFVKCADAYKFRRKYILFHSLIMRLGQVWTLSIDLMHQRIVWMPQPSAALSITNMMNPHLFFFTLSISFFLVAHALPCGKLVGLFPCASKGIIHHLCLRQLVLNKTKRMTGKSLCEMRGWV